MSQDIPYSVLYDFDNLYQAHRRAKLGKGGTREVVMFDMGLSGELWELANDLYLRQYQPGPYLTFTVQEPKRRLIHAASYRDRVLQHCLCDNILAPALETRLIHDNAACRVGKGTHFAISRLSGFMRSHLRRYGDSGYFVKVDVTHYFASIRHDILKSVLWKVFRDVDVRGLLATIIDSYHTDGEPGIGLPLGNQTSQWFALLYLDGLDRLVKERCRVHYYTRYMDDMVLILPSKAEAIAVLERMRQFASGERGLTFNAKTQVSPMKAGITYLGWRFVLSPTGKVVRRLDAKKKSDLRRKWRALQSRYGAGTLTSVDLGLRAQSTVAHLAHGHTYGLRRTLIADRGFSR